MASPPSSHSLWRSIATELITRLKWPILALVAIFLFGTLGYYWLGGDQWSLIDSLYMTSITLTTVGYGETHELGPTGRIFTLFLLWAGFAGVLYATAIITAFLVEINIGALIKERRMQQRIDDLSDHFIICGAGETGKFITRELHLTKRPLVVIEHNPQEVENLLKQYEDLLVVLGDATDEAILQRAGIERARGVIATLGDDGTNMLVTVSARFINPHVKIGTRCRDNHLADKFYRAGADYVVNPFYIGGMRLASEMIRPQVVTFLDRMLRAQGSSRVEEVRVQESSTFIGKTLADADIKGKTGLLPIALEKSDGEVVFNPTGNEIVEAGLVLIVIATPEELLRLRSFVNA